MSYFIQNPLIWYFQVHMLSHVYNMLKYIKLW